jgi:hypothetical protein
VLAATAAAAAAAGATTTTLAGPSPAAVVQLAGTQQHTSCCTLLCPGRSTLLQALSLTLYMQPDSWRLSGSSGSIESIESMTTLHSSYVWLHTDNTFCGTVRTNGSLVCAALVRWAS